MTDGQSKPDYELIEIGAMTGMTILVNEVKTSPETTVRAYERLKVLHATLMCTGVDCPPFNLVVLESMIQGALPLDYQMLGVAAVRLIKSRANLYLDEKLPDSENVNLIRKISASVVLGMIQALEPRVHSIRG